MKRFALYLSIFLLIGAGCSNATPSDTTPVAEETPAATSFTEVVRQPVGSDTLSYALSICESHELELVLKYNPDADATQEYCQFEDGYSCYAIEYITGACHSTSTNRVFLSDLDAVPSNIRSCADQESPVCGTNGITYINECIAELQEVTILHEGTCTGEEDVQPDAPASNTNTSGSSQIFSPPSGSPSWLNALKTLGATDHGVGAPLIKECIYQDTRVFYMIENCPTCFSTLYNNDGEVLCHPHNDIAAECPGFFDKNNHSANCNVL